MRRDISTIHAVFWILTIVCVAVIFYWAAGDLRWVEVAR